MVDVDMLCKNNTQLREFCKDRIVRLGFDHGFECRQCPYHNTEKTDAGNAVHKAIKDGTIPPPWEHACVRCGGVAKLYHHPDYTRPLYVEAMCCSCHSAIHAEMRKERVT